MECIDRHAEANQDGLSRRLGLGRHGTSLRPRQLPVSHRQINSDRARSGAASVERFPVKPSDVIQSARLADRAPRCRGCLVVCPSPGACIRRTPGTACASCPYRRPRLTRDSPVHIQSRRQLDPTEAAHGLACPGRLQ